MIYYKATPDGNVEMTPSEVEELLSSQDAIKREQSVIHRIKRKHGRMALAQAGRLADVPAAIAAMSEPNRTYAQLAWEDEEYWVRTNDFVLGMATALGLTDAETDDLFRAAHALSLQ